MKNQKESFQEKVYQFVKKIPRGKVATYGQIARLAGSPNAARAVGAAMKNNPDTNTIPCHRVVGEDGKMHGYNSPGGADLKQLKLKREGVLFEGDKVNLPKSRWRY